MNYCQDRTQAVATVRGGPDHPQLQGTVSFKQVRGGVLVTAELFGLPRQTASGCGFFAFHIHAGPGCGSREGESFGQAGAHYNPQGQPHPCHAGDLPPLLGDGGYAYMSVFSSRFTVEELIGRVVIIHSRADDFRTQPAGDPGQKIACGKICASPG